MDRNSRLWLLINVLSEKYSIHEEMVLVNDIRTCLRHIFSIYYSCRVHFVFLLSFHTLFSFYWITFSKVYVTILCELHSPFLSRNVSFLFLVYQLKPLPTLCLCAHLFFFICRFMSLLKNHPLCTNWISAFDMFNICNSMSYA